MNMSAFLRQHIGLTSLVILLVGAFLLKNAEKTELTGTQTNPLTLQANNTAKGQTSASLSTKSRTVSSANVASSLSQAIHASLRPKVQPLPDFSAMTDVKIKKNSFFNYVQGLANTANGKVVQMRNEINRMQPQKLTQQQAQLLTRLSKRHKVKTKLVAEQIDQLLYKIQPVPVALVLAQAANESAWGTSRFATEGNNLFGQWCFSQGCGLVPSGRPEGETYEVQKFKDPQISVDAYIRNLNSHASYRGLRKIRACLVERNEVATARALSAGLMSYSSRGVDYIDDIRSMIRVNKLELWQKNWWGNATQHPCSHLVQLVLPKIATEDPIHGITAPETR